MRAFLLCLGCVACSSTPAAMDGGGEGGSTDSATTDGGGDSGITTKFIGSVLVSSTNTTTSKRNDIFGIFQSTAGAGMTSCLPAVTEGPCTFQDCSTTGGASDAGTPTYLGAGTLEVTVGSGTAMMIPRMANGEYRSMGAMPLFAGGENVRAKATGDAMGAPAFDMMVAAPSHITLTMPAAMPSLTFMRSQPLVVVWTGGSIGTVNVAVSTYPMGRVNAITCPVPASSGTMTIPASLLGKLAAGSGFFGVSIFSTTTMIQGDWGLSVAAYDTVVDTNGKGVTLASATYN